MLKLPEKLITEPNFLDILSNIDLYPEYQKLITAEIPMVENNGIETVCPVFQKSVLDFDAMAEGEKEAKKAAEFGLQNIDDQLFGLIFINLKSAYQQAIQKLTMDFSERHSSWSEYLDGVKRLGFKEFAEFNSLGRDETQDVTKLFWHTEHSILWVVDSYTSCNGRKVNSSFIHLCGTYLTKGDYGRDVLCSRGVTFNTDTTHLDCDMREMPTYKLQNILTSFAPSEYWTEFGVFNKTIEHNFSSLPQDIVDKMISRSCSDYEFEHRGFEKHKMHKTLDQFVDTLNEDELEKAIAWVAIFGFENKKPSVLPIEIIEKVKLIEDADVNALGYLSELLHVKRSKSFSWEDTQKIAIDSFSNEALKFWFEKIEKLKKEINYSSVDDSIYDILVERFKVID